MAHCERHTLLLLWSFTEIQWILFSTRTLHYHPGSDTRSIKAIKNVFVSSTNHYFKPFAKIQQRSFFSTIWSDGLLYISTLFIWFSSFVQIGSLPLFSIKSWHFQILNSEALAKVAYIIDFMMVLTNTKTQHVHFLQFVSKGALNRTFQSLKNCGLPKTTTFLPPIWSRSRENLPSFPD